MSANVTIFNLTITYTCSELSASYISNCRFCVPKLFSIMASEDQGMPSVSRKSVTKPVNSSLTKHEDQTKRSSFTAYDDTDVSTIRLPTHAIFPELPTAQGELFFECTLFLYSVLAMFLQYLNLYKTMWWLPHSHVHYSLKFHLIDLYLLSCIGLILGRRVTVCFLKKISLLPPGCDAKHTPLYITILEWSIKLPAVVAILSSFSFSFLQVLSSYSWSSLIYVVYPILFYVLLFYNEIFTIFADSASGHQQHHHNHHHTHGSSKANQNQNNFLKSFVLNLQRSPYYVDSSTRHACSLSANSIREEADILIADFYQRFKQSLFAALTTGYYAIFLPCCFSPHYLYVDIWWSFEVCLIVCATSWTIYTSYLFPLQYCDLLHRCAQHLGAWEKLERQPSHLMQLPIPTWSENYTWNEGSVVKQGRSVYKGQGLIVAAEPSNTDHFRFYMLLKDPMLIVNGMCGIQACLIFCQFLMLVHSTEWQHIITLALLMFANYLLLFKLFKDKIIMGRIYHPNFEDVGSSKKLH